MKTDCFTYRRSSLCCSKET